MVAYALLLNDAVDEDIPALKAAVEPLDVILRAKSLVSPSLLWKSIYLPTSITPSLAIYPFTPHLFPLADATT